METTETSPMEKLWSVDTRVTKWWAIVTANARALQEAGLLLNEDLAFLDAINPDGSEVNYAPHDFSDACIEYADGRLRKRKDLMSVVYAFRGDPALELVNLLLLWESSRLLTTELQARATRFTGDVHCALRLQAHAITELVSDPLHAVLPGQPQHVSSVLGFLGLQPAPLGDMRTIQRARCSTVQLILRNLAATALRVAPHKHRFMALAEDLQKACVKPKTPLRPPMGEYDMFPEREYRFYHDAFRAAANLLADDAWRDVT